MFPAGAVQAASSNVSLHGNTEFTSNGASVGGKTIRIDADIPTMPVRVKNYFELHTIHRCVCISISFPVGSR